MDDLLRARTIEATCTSLVDIATTGLAKHLPVFDQGKVFGAVVGLIATAHGENPQNRALFLQGFQAAFQGITDGSLFDAPDNGIAIPTTPVPVPEPGRCQARQESDQVRCPVCRLVWDVNDSDAPPCPHGRR